MVIQQLMPPASAHIVVTTTTQVGWLTASGLVAKTRFGCRNLGDLPASSRQQLLKVFAAVTGQA